MKTTIKTTEKPTTKTPKDLAGKYQLHKKDTGSVQVQITLLTKRISELSSHLEAHRKDNDSRRGLLILVGKRRRLLNYLRKNEPETYQKLVKDLGLRK